VTGTPIASSSVCTKLRGYEEARVMTPIKPRWVSIALGLVAAASIACGESSGTVSPSGVSGGRSGAVITGRVSGINSLPVATGVLGPLATTSVRVTISGTDISTVVDGTGNFMLTGVPPGTVTLQFSGSGVSATITLTGVTAGETIRIEITLTGSGARLDSERRDRDGDDDDDDEDKDDGLTELTGTVSNLTGTCPSLTFVVREQTVRTGAGTSFDGGCSRVKNGVRVEAKGALNADGALIATRVELDD